MYINICLKKRGFLYMLIFYFVESGILLWCVHFKNRFVNFPEQPVVWREISIITSALRNDSQDTQTQFLRSE